MRSSESLERIAPALVKAQAAFPVVAKDGTAKIVSKTGASFAYDYATLPDVHAAILPILAANGLAVIQGTADEDDSGFTVETTILHTSAEWYTVRVRVPVASNTAQAAGSGFAYGRRIGLIGAVCVTTDELDDDGAAATHTTAKATTGHITAKGNTTATVLQGHPTLTQIPPKAPPSSPAPRRDTPAPKVVPNDGLPTSCPVCGDKVYDNRAKKASGEYKPKSKDWNCANKECKTEGYRTGGWLDDGPLAEFAKMPEVLEEAPLEEDAPW
jgi:hypothetical protein